MVPSERTVTPPLAVGGSPVTRAGGKAGGREPGAYGPGGSRGCGSSRGRGGGGRRGRGGGGGRGAAAGADQQGEHEQAADTPHSPRVTEVGCVGAGRPAQGAIDPNCASRCSNCSARSRAWSSNSMGVPAPSAGAGWVVAVGLGEAQALNSAATTTNASARPPSGGASSERG